MRTSLLFSFALAASTITFSASAQLTARDAFWSASDLVSVSANPGGKAVKAVRPSTSTSKSSGTAQRPRDPRAAAQLIASNGYGEQPHLVRTSLQTQQLGLRYSVLKEQADGSYAEVSVDNTFHEGDLLKLSVMSNEPGYLYVIQQGSSGTWSPIFPDEKSGSNRVEPGRPYQIPGDSQKFQVNNPPGTDKLFVVLSRKPISDLGGAIERLQNSSHSTPRPARVPDPSQVVEASNHIPDNSVQQLASRDLTLVTEQKVGSSTTGTGIGEKAVYVVAKQDAQAPTHEVVAHITLNHE